MIDKNIYVEHCFLLTTCTLCTLLWKRCVSVSEGKFQSGGSKVCLRIISDHFKAGPSSVFLYDSRPQLHFSLRAHYSGRCPIVLSLRAFSWAYQKHNTKICREEEENKEEEEEVEVEGWPEPTWRSPRETLALKNRRCFFLVVRAAKKRCLVPFWTHCLDVEMKNRKPPSAEVHITKVQCCPFRNDVVRTRACPALSMCVHELLWPHWKVWKKHNKGAVDRCFNNRRTTDAVVF